MFLICDVWESALVIYRIQSLISNMQLSVLVIIQRKDGIHGRYRPQNMILFHSSHHLAIWCLSSDGLVFLGFAF